MKDIAEEKKVLNTSDEAAKYVTGIEGWVDRHGHFYGKDERLARWAGATHVSCSECGAETNKTYTICYACRCKKELEKFYAKKIKDWNGITPLYSELTENYFFDLGDLQDYLCENKLKVDSMMLVICTPNKLRELDEDYFCDELPEDGELPPDVYAAIVDLNRVIKEQEPISWSPGPYRANCGDYLNDHDEDHC